MLKKLRVLFAVVMGVVITFYVPALLAGSFGIVLILLVATLLFGRI